MSAHFTGNLPKVDLTMCRFFKISLGIPGVLSMSQTINRRRAPRLRYRVIVRYAENSEDKKVVSEGQMLDVSSGGLAFRCSADENCPYEGQSLVTQFNIPNAEVHDSSMMEFTRTGHVLRVQKVNPNLRNVAVRFDEPLPVGKVYFDTIGLYLSSPESQAVSTEENIGEVKDKSLELILEKRIEELERELAELKQMQFRNSQSAKVE